MCIPSEQQYTLIPWELVLNATKENWKEKRESLSPRDKKIQPRRYLGWDIATSEHGDYSVFFILERIEDKVYVCDYEYMKGIDLPVQRERLAELVSQWNVGKICLDAGGIGRDSAQILARKYGDYMVEGFMSSTTSKHEICGKMLSCFQEGSIIIPNDELLMKDINSVEKVYSKAGNITYSSPRINASHGDGFWSLAYALRACGWKTGESIKILSQSQESLTEQTIFNDRTKRNAEKDRNKDSKKRARSLF